MIEKNAFVRGPETLCKFRIFLYNIRKCSGPRTVCKNRGLARPAVGVFVNGFWNFRVGCLVSRIHQFVSRVGCLVSRVWWVVCHIAYLVAGVSCLVCRDFYLVCRV